MERIAILHSDGPRNTLYAAITGRLQGKPVVWHVRTSRKDPYDALLYFACTRLILVADALKSRFRFRGAAGKCVTIHNGVDVLRFRPSRAVGADGTEFGVERNDLVIATAGRVEASKGQLTLIEACAALKANHPNFKLLLAGRVGEPPYARRCRQRAAELGLGDRVRFLGHVPDMHRLLPHTDIFVLPSIADEAFPRSTLEAMAAGLPVAATDVGGAREAVLDNETGFLVPAGSRSALSDKLKLLAGDPELRRRMGRAGRARAVCCFDIQDNVARTGRLYQELQERASMGLRLTLPDRRRASRQGPAHRTPVSARRNTESV
ncbi:MAG: glycosyltransferase [Desulfobacterales bacterium]|nr:glycosyltransferase [Desulfobacterales bacterium]